MQFWSGTAHGLDDFVSDRDVLALVPVNSDSPVASVLRAEVLAHVGARQSLCEFQFLVS